MTASLLRLIPCALAAALALSACASFERPWKAAARPTPGDPFDGQWEGRWTSTRHAHSGGPLRCALIELEPHSKLSDAQYRGTFRAGWHQFHSTYSTVFTTERQRDRLLLHGEQNLGFLFGGVYRYEGVVTPQRFRATYRSSYDSGTFEMTRPARCAAVFEMNVRAIATKRRAARVQ